MEYNNTTYTAEARLQLEKTREILALREERAYYANKVADYEDLMEKNDEERDYYASNVSYYRDLQERCEERIRELQGKSK